MTFEEWFGQDLTGKTYNGYINCSNSQLTSLKGCPEIVKGNFICSDNDLTSLEYAPKEVHGNFSCSENKITSLKGLNYYENLSLDFSQEEIEAYYLEHYPEMMI